MKKIWFVMMAVATLFAFPGCSSDDDGNDTVDNSKKHLAEITVKEHQWKFGGRSDYGELYERYTYNEKGKLTKFETNYYLSVAKSRIPESTVYTYDERDRVIEKNEYELSLLQYKYKYQYNDFDSVSVMQKYTKEGTLSEEWTYEYDSNRRLSKCIERNAFFSTPYGYIHTFIYGNNTITEVETKLSDGSPWYTMISEFDSHGNLVKKTYTNDETGRVETDVYSYVYDSKGRMTKKTFPESIGNGKRVNDYTYNEDGTINTIHVSYTGKNDQSDLVYTYTWK